MQPLRAMAGGGFSDHVAAPDGRLREAAQTPFFPLDEQGRLFVPDHLT